MLDGLCCVFCVELLSHRGGGDQGMEKGGFSWTMNDRGVLIICLASWMVLWRAGLFIAVLKYLRAITWCLCLMVWMPVIL